MKKNKGYAKPRTNEKYSVKDDPQVAALIHEMEVQENYLQKQNRLLIGAQKKLANANKRLLKQYHQAPVGYMTLDLQGKIRNANQTAATLLSRDLTNLINTPFTSLIVDIDQARFHQHFRTVTRRGHSDSVELGLVCGNGREIQARLQSAISEEASGHSEGVNIVISDISAKSRYKRLLRRTSIFQRTLIKSSPFAIIATDIKGVIQTVNPAAEELFGYTVNELVGRMTPIQLLLWREIRANIADLKSSVVKNPLDILLSPAVKGGNGPRELTYVAKSGKRGIISLSVAEVRDSKGELSGLILEALDITQRKHQENTIKQLNRKLNHRLVELHRAQQRAQTTLMAIADGVVITDSEGRIEKINPTAERLLGWKEAEAIGESIETLFYVEDRDGKQVSNKVSSCLRKSKVVPASGPQILISRDGNRHHIEENVAPIFDDFGRLSGAVLVFRDVTHNIRLIQKMIYQATHDELTGLANRREFNRRLRQTLTSMKESANQSNALLVMDLDRFKAVNDTCGHVAGDELLKQLSQIISEAAGENAVVGRMGGDEFAVILENCSVESAYNRALVILQNVQEHRFYWDDHIFNIGISIGLKMIDAQVDSITQLQSQADAAAYTAKNAGRNRIHIFGEFSESVFVDTRLDWYHRINKALEENQLELFTQTIQPLSQNMQPHVELLLRMNTPDQGIILPTEFIPSAERYNLMPAIDRWVVRNAFAWLADHREWLEKNEWCSINLSGPSLSEDGFRVFLEDQFRRWKLPYHNICFEITETLGILNIEATLRLMNHFHDLGCLFSMDDFGSGFSSYQHLKTLPVDFIKIDGNFVRNAVNSSVDFAMVKSICEIGLAMGKKTIAEYVENDKILDMMRDLGVDYAQGFYFDKPVSLAEHGRVSSSK